MTTFPRRILSLTAVALCAWTLNGAAALADDMKKEPNAMSAPNAMGAMSKPNAMSDDEMKKKHDAMGKETMGKPGMNKDAMGKMPMGKDAMDKKPEMGEGTAKP